MHGIRIPYTAWLHCSSSGIVNQKSSFLRANMPVKSGKEILWNDEKYQVEGKWIMDSKPVGESGDKKRRQNSKDCTGDS